MSSKTAVDAVGHQTLSRILEEGYGPGAWHGADIKAAVADVTPETAFQRPAPGRHNIAEIALHHAFYVHDVRGRLTGVSPGSFVHEEGEWVELGDSSRFSWDRITETLDAEQQQLADVVAGVEASPLTNAERFDLALGITCHAIYHAGQIQLVKKLVT